MAVVEPLRRDVKSSDPFIKTLEAEGVEHLFGIPGEDNLDLLDSLSRSSITLILTQDEQASGFMAETYGRLTGKAACVCRPSSQVRPTLSPRQRTPSSAACPC